MIKFNGYNVPTILTRSFGDGFKWRKVKDPNDKFDESHKFYYRVIKMITSSDIIEYASRISKLKQNYELTKRPEIKAEMEYICNYLDVPYIDGITTDYIKANCKTYVDLIKTVKGDDVGYIMSPIRYSYKDFRSLFYYIDAEYEEWKEQQEAERKAANSELSPQF